jgi:hypothetical protein
MKHTNYFLVTALAYLACFWFLNYQLGFFSFAQTSSEPALRDASAAFVAPLLTAALIYSNALVIQLGSRSLACISIINNKREYSKAKRRFTNFILRFQLLNLKLTPLIAACFAISYLYLSGIPDANPEQDYRWVLFAQIFPFWTLLVMLVFSIYKVHQSLRLLLSKFARISLFESEKLKPISDFLFASFFIYCTLNSIYLLVTLFVELLWLDIAILGIISLITLVALIAPLNIMQTTIRTQKESTISAINALLSEQLTIQNHHNESNDGHIRRLVDDVSRLQHASDLLLVRQEVKSMSTLPVTLPTMMKFLLILLIPLFSWVGAGVVSQLLKLVL